MTEKARPTFITREQYERNMNKRLVQTSLAEATIYLLMLEVKSDKYPAATLPFDFNKIVRFGDDGRQTSAFSHFGRFLSDNELPVLDVAGKIENDFISFEGSLLFGDPVNATIGQGYILDADHELDEPLIETEEPVEGFENIDDELAMMLLQSRELVGSHRG